MPFKEVKKEMGELRERLSDIPADTQKLEEVIEDARTGIEDYTPEAMNDFVEFMKSEMEDLETEHPDLTAFINQIMVTLSNIGI